MGSSTHNKREIIPAGTTNLAGGTTIGEEFDLSTKFGGGICLRLTNGATGPSVAPVAQVLVAAQISVGSPVVANYFPLCRDDGTLAKLTGNTTNNSVSEMTIDVPPWVMFINVSVTGNTVQPITCEAIFQEITTT